MPGQPPNTPTRRAADLTLSKRAHYAAELPWENLRDSAVAVRRESVEEMNALVAEFIRRAQDNGHRVLRASTAAHARDMVTGQIGAHGGGVLIKSKSMVTEEIALRPHLERIGWTVYETDLGEWIVQLRNELPAHVTAPAIHLSAAEVAETLGPVTGHPLPADATALAQAATDHLRIPLRSSAIGVSGANFLIAETGEIVIVENEGNAFFCTSAPQQHIVVTGIDKVIRSRTQLPGLLKLLTVSATGQPQTAYTHVIGKASPAGPRRTIVLVDNGRSALARSAYSDAARCIRCGACMNICPVFRQVSGHGYRTVYPGPIGLLIAPFLEPQRLPPDAPYFSTLCGACADICPVRIPIHTLIARQRADAWRSGSTPLAAGTGLTIWKLTARSGLPGRLATSAARAMLRHAWLRRLGQLLRLGRRR